MSRNVRLPSDRAPCRDAGILSPRGRRGLLKALGSLVAAALLLASLTGCEDEEPHAIGKLENVWGKVGLGDGRLQKPRAMAIGKDERTGDDRIYIVDMTARIQVFDTEGNFLRVWKTPESKIGRPTGISIGRDGQVLVADTHYHRVLIYSPEGELQGTIGGVEGVKPGEFGLVRDVVQDSEGNYYVSDEGENDRIQKFDAAGKFLTQWGGHGSEPGQFSRPHCLALDEEENLWVADACNHRVQVFDRNGKLLRIWGEQGDGPGQLAYPYGLILSPNQTVYIAEFGNDRVQKLTREGQSLGWWGTHGHEPGQLYCPWALVRDSRGRILVLDTNNHRVQVVKM